MGILIIFGILLEILAMFYYLVIRENRKERKRREKCIDCVWDKDCSYQQQGIEAKCS